MLFRVCLHEFMKFMRRFKSIVNTNSERSMKRCVPSFLESIMIIKRQEYKQRDSFLGAGLLACFFFVYCVFLFNCYVFLLFQLICWFFVSLLSVDFCFCLFCIVFSDVFVETWAALRTGGVLHCALLLPPAWKVKAEWRTVSQWRAEASRKNDVRLKNTEKCQGRVAYSCRNPRQCFSHVMK